ncbi:MAG: hypothetical protein JO112_11970 [Planctomycetes bacterium]|nr:hypothetical protein [Planctomycetota bacterium]
MLAVPFPTPRTVRPPSSREDSDSFGQITTGQAAQALAGGGLLTWGLLRGSWSGLALTAVGGLLVWHALTRREGKTTPSERLLLGVRTSPRKAENAKADRDLWPQAGRGKPVPQAEEKAVALVEVQQGSARTSVRITPWPTEELTPEEHAEARVLAYFHALERGGGSLPPYDSGAAAGDFRRAAGEVLAQRLGG